jgi:two-component system response regulator AtoC
LAINCGAIPENLIESELFGYKKGAFTGATHDRKGLFEEADTGTIFLDEIGELPSSLQVKLLRVLQEGEIRRIGEEKSYAIDIRVIAATSKDLPREVQRGTFREDLFYRLNVIPIHIPPLRDRKEDIPILVEHFIHNHNKSLGLHIEGITPQALKILLDYHWAGNVRELENVIERIMVLTDKKRIDTEDIPENILQDTKKSIYTIAEDEYSIKKNGNGYGSKAHKKSFRENQRQ